jgi:transposase
MEVVFSRCCGMDVHQASVVACALLDEGGRKPKKVVRTFPTMRQGLEQLRDWLASLAVTHVTMEGTGVYWRPVYSTLEGHVDIALVNARHVKALQGRKTDVNDAEWLASLLRHGLLRKSFVPAKDVRAIRDLCRYRRMLVQSQTTEKNRIIKLLEIIGIKLATVASDVFGTSGMLMLRAIAAGSCTAEQIAPLAKGRLRSKLPELRLALDVLVEEHHRVMLSDQLARLDQTAAEVARYDSLLEKQVAPYEESLALLCTIDGIRRIAAIEIFAEIGPDVASFPSAAQFASWAGTCPGQHQSGGKSFSTRRRKGNPYLQSILVEASLAATRKKATYFTDKYRRLKSRRGSMRALFAIAHKLACAVHRVLQTHEPYRDLGGNYLDLRHKRSTAHALAKRLQSLGYDQNNVVALFERLQPVASTTQLSPEISEG